MNTLLVQNEADVHAVIETRGGKYVRTISDPGLHLIPPWQKVAGRITKHPVETLAATCAASREQANVVVSVKMDFLITDPARWHSHGNDPCKAVEADLGEAIRSVASGIGLADLWAQRDYLGERSRHVAAQTVDDKFGISLRDVFVQQISHDSGCMSTPGEKLQAVMRQAAAMPDKVAHEMGEGLAGKIAVRKPIVLKKR